jgi:8-oxo-dGTP diphosphatase
MTSYVVGFLFDQTLENVVLIRKAKPAWQKGKWNGVGGKIEPHETAADAMSREFEEEAGIKINPKLWMKYCRLFNADWEIYFFVYIASHAGVHTVTDEIVEKWGLPSLLTGQTPIPLLGNLKWHMQLALAIAKGEETCTYFEIEEKTRR